MSQGARKKEGRLDPPYCHLCDVSFDSEQDLDHHKWLGRHRPTEDRCCLCYGRFRRATDLRRHLKNNHGYIYGKEDAPPRDLAEAKRMGKWVPLDSLNLTPKQKMRVRRETDKIHQSRGQIIVRDIPLKDGETPEVQIECPFWLSEEMKKQIKKYAAMDREYDAFKKGRTVQECKRKIRVEKGTTFTGLVWETEHLMMGANLHPHQLRQDHWDRGMSAQRLAKIRDYMPPPSPSRFEEEEWELDQGTLTRRTDPAPEQMYLLPPPASSRKIIGRGQMSSDTKRTLSPVGGFGRGLDAYTEVGPSRGAPTDQEITKSLSSLDVTSEVWELDDDVPSETAGPSTDTEATSESAGPSTDTPEATNGSSEPDNQHMDTPAGETKEPLQEPREEFQDPEEFFDAIEDSSDEAYEDEYLDVIGGCRIA